MNARYVLSIRMTGLGDRIICLGAAWRYARLTGRVLAVDWRYSGISPNPAVNGFRLCFGAPPTLAGVPFLASLDMRALSFPTPRFPRMWEWDDLLSQPFLRPFATIVADNEIATRLIQEGRDVEEATVVFDSCVNDGLVDLEEARRFLAALEPVPRIQAAVREFRERSLSRTGHCIGIHVRHGNGGNIMGHTRYWVSFDDAIQRCLNAIAHARRLLGEDAIVLLCTDSSEVIHAISSRVPDLVIREKFLRRSGEGELHLRPQAWTGRDDALIEMLLLAECDALIRYPPGSFFSFYAAVKLSRGNPEAMTISDLQRPWDEGDMLSPSIQLRDSLSIEGQVEG